eukprot:scaffold5021_cov260-Chaetoceros_neogracile.AAC.7
MHTGRLKKADETDVSKLDYDPVDSLRIADDIASLIRCNVFYAIIFPYSVNTSVITKWPILTA